MYSDIEVREMLMFDLDIQAQSNVRLPRTKTHPETRKSRDPETQKLSETQNLRETLKLGWIVH